MTQTKRTEKGSTETPEILETVATFYAQGIDRLAEVQKKGLDLATRQNNEILDSWKKIASAVPGGSGLQMLDLASKAFDRFADMQKGAINLMLTQSDALLCVVREGASSASEANGISAGLVQQAVEESVSAQKKALDEFAAQSRPAFEKAKSQLGLAGTPAEAVADALQRGVESLTENQKEFLDFATSPLHTTKPGPKNGKA